MAEVDLDQRAITAIRTLAMDAVESSHSGHPGTPMAMAPVAYWLWHRVLRFDPDDPIWPNGDRFVLSIGHASMLLYALLHLAEVQAVDAEYERVGRPSVTLDDIRCFRQLESRCPGHPEYRWTSGVETTTGPLGQGVATSVGMAVAARWLAARFNRPGFDLFDYNVYALTAANRASAALSSSIDNSAAIKVAGRYWNGNAHLTPAGLFADARKIVDLVWRSGIGGVRLPIAARADSLTRYQVNRPSSSERVLDGGFSNGCPVTTRRDPSGHTRRGARHRHMARRQSCVPTECPF